MIPYGRQDIKKEDIDAVVEILNSDFLTQGPTVPEFEKRIANYVGAEFGVATNSASSALHVACLALGVSQGDQVWTSSNTFVASANCALHCGADIDFVDIDQETYNMSVKSLEKKLAEAEKKGNLPKVVIPVHYAGQSCEMASIKKLSEKYGFKIIEDASHAIGAKYKGFKVGSGRYSDITVFSFHPVKIITTGEGGMALTNSEILAKKLRQYRSHGISSDTSDMYPRSDAEIWNYQQIKLGFNYRMTDIHAALGISQLNNLDSFIRTRHIIAKRYNERLAELPLILPKQHSDTFSSFHLYPIRIQKNTCGKSQRQVYQSLLESKIWVNIHYIPVHRQPYFETLGFREGYCPEAEAFHSETISLPIFPKLSEAEQEHVIDVLKKALK